MEVLYEASGKFGISIPFILLSFADLVFIIFSTTNLRRILIGEKRAFTTGEKIFFSFIIVVLSTLVISIGLSGLNSAKVYSAYQRGEAQVVEGVISEYDANLELNEQPDSFMVDGVWFEVPCFTTPWGYPLRQQDGGVLKEGMHVKIYYVSYKYDNIIMKIETYIE